MGKNFMTKFSKKLVEKCIALFKEKYDKEIDEETADQYLGSFARFFLAFVRPEKGLEDKENKA